MTDFLSDLNQKQLEAVKCTDGPLLILAGAGSGKTRVIIYRIAHLIKSGVNPWNILAMTFTNKAANQMKTRISALVDGAAASSVWISTYHSFCARLLRIEAGELGLDRNFTIYDDSDSKKLVELCLKELGHDTEKFKPSAILDAISSAKDKLLDSESYSYHAMTTSESQRRVAADVYALYQKKLNEMGVLDFGDLLSRTVELFKTKPHVLEKYQERFRYVMIDEYQDTNYAQYVLTKLLSARYKNVCVVGDDDQAIYSWRGADLRNILDFERDYPNANVVYLEQNYRSTKKILDTAWNLIHHNNHRKPKKLWTDKQAGEDIIYTEFSTEFEEAARVAERIKHGVENDGRRLSDFAVFYRTNAQSRIFEEVFTRYGVPYVVVGSQKFYERAEVKDVLAYLRLINNPTDNITFRRVINVPARGIGKTTLLAIENRSAETGASFFESAKAMYAEGALKKAEKFLRLIDSMHSEMQNMSVSDIVRIVLEETGYIRALEAQNDLESRGRIENVKELVSAIADFEHHSEEKSLSAFLENISLVSDVDSWDEKSDYVTFITLHLAKGLEFPCVFVTGLEEGLFPLTESSLNLDSLEEERRLCYVGITRARERLFLSGAARRRVYGQMRFCIPSRFIKEAGLRQETVLRTEEFRHDYGMPVPQFSAGVQAGTGSSGFANGAKVRHPEFGAGRIINVSGSGDDLKVIVQFEAGFWKKLLVKYAKLEVL
jgi:DNA helicase-2/ATP-dependent DNA helicase PcrA